MNFSRGVQERRFLTAKAAVAEFLRTSTISNRTPAFSRTVLVLSRNGSAGTALVLLTHRDLDLYRLEPGNLVD